MDWQSIVAISIVVGAAAWLARRSWRLIVAGCGGRCDAGGCHGCPKQPAAVNTIPLVELRKSRG
jgi:hypothetical protein